jgi:hypothetical protein
LLHNPLTNADLAELDEEIATNMWQVSDDQEKGNNVSDLDLAHHSDRIN